MFDNIAQIEKEVQEFRANILASREFLQHLKDLTEAINREHETLLEKMADLQVSVEYHTTDNTQRVSASVDSLLKGHEKAADDLATEIHTTMENLRKGTAEDISRLQIEVSAAVDRNSENLRVVSQKYDDFLIKVDLLLKGYEKAADNLATEIHAAVENLRQGNADDIVHLNTTVETIMKNLHQRTAEDISHLQTEVNIAVDRNSENLRVVSQKYDDFLVKIESFNLDRIYEYCVQLERSVNQKFMILGAGIGVTAILTILSIVL